MNIADMYEKVFEDLVMEYCDRNGIFLDKKECKRVVHDMVYNCESMWEYIDDVIGNRLEHLKDEI